MMKLLDASLRVLRAAAEHRLIAGLQVELLDLDPRGREHFAERHPVDVGLDRDLPLPVVAIDRRRAALALEERDIADLDDPSGAGRNQQVAHRRRIVAERLVEPEPDDDLVVAVLELADLFAADQRPQVGGQRIDVDAKVGRARAIDGDLQLRLRRLEVGVGVHDAVDGADLLHQLGGVDLQLLDIGSLNQDLQAVAAALVAPAAAASPRRRRRPGCRPSRRPRCPFRPTR